MIIKFVAGINIEIDDDCVTRWEQTESGVRVFLNDGNGFRTVYFDKNERKFFVEAPKI